MLPLRLGRIFDRAPAPSRPNSVSTLVRLAPEPPPLIAPIQEGKPAFERRVTADRRGGDRRGQQKTAFLDTRSGSGRRRSPGRRAEDNDSGVPYQRISIRA